MRTNWLAVERDDILALAKLTCLGIRNAAPQVSFRSQFTNLSIHSRYRSVRGRLPSRGQSDASSQLGPPDGKLSARGQIHIFRSPLTARIVGVTPRAQINKHEATVLRNKSHPWRNEHVCHVAAMHPFQRALQIRNAPCTDSMCVSIYWFYLHRAAAASLVSSAPRTTNL